MALAAAQKRKKKDDGDEKGADMTFWMVTFGDLLSLLLTFFVLLFAMSTLDNQVVKEMFSTFTGGAGALSFNQAYPIEPPRMAKIQMARTISIKEFMDFLNEEKGKTKSEINIKGLVDTLLIQEVTIRKRGPDFVLSFASRQMFPPGSATIDRSIYPALDRLAEALAYSESQLLIEGHTDDLPIDTPRFPSNWELSAARAAAVMEYLEGAGIGGGRLKAIGFADTRPLVANLSEGYRARNRRVDIVIMQAPEGERAREQKREIVPLFPIL